MEDASDTVYTYKPSKVYKHILRLQDYQMERLIGIEGDGLVEAVKAGWLRWVRVTELAGASYKGSDEAWWLYVNAMADVSRRWRFGKNRFTARQEFWRCIKAPFAPAPKPRLDS
jgi:hypothetical protein